MIVIGEKINGTRKAVGAAIRERDAERIKQLALDQVQAGSAYLDVNAGTSPEREPDDMAWLVTTIQEAVDVPLCLDSANPEALRAGLALVRKTPLINSVSGEKPRIDGVLPLALEYKTGLILLALDDTVGIPDTSKGRLDIVHRLVAMAKQGGLEEDQLYVDPLVTAVSTGDKNALLTFEAIRMIKQSYPEAHVTCGLSNVSFGMPLRSLINQTFVAMCIQMGLDSAIIDPNNRDLTGVIAAAEMLMGQDKYCQRFNRAYRAGKIGPQKHLTVGG
jgi:5-methyltetrahydrofolate corrinoid/iron sulfur protein methyltransferase